MLGNRPNVREKPWLGHGNGVISTTQAAPVVLTRAGENSTLEILEYSAVLEAVRGVRKSSGEILGCSEVVMVESWALCFERWKFGVGEMLIYTSRYRLAIPQQAFSSLCSDLA
jgi:hypothetical protein